MASSVVFGHDGGAPDVHSDFGVNGSSSSKKTISPTDCLLVAIAKRIWNFIEDFNNMMFIAEIDWALKKVISLADIFHWGEFLFALPFLNIALTPIIAPHFAKKMKDKFVMAWVAASVNRIGRMIYYAGQGIGTLGTFTGVVTKSIESVLALLGSSAGKLLFGTFLPPVLLATTSFGAIFKTWRLGRNLYDYVGYQRVLSQIDTEDGLRAFYDRVMGPKKVVDLTATGNLDAAAKKTERVYKLAWERFKESHASKEFRYKEIKTMFFYENIMTSCEKELEVLQGVSEQIKALHVLGPVQSLIVKLVDLKASIETEDIWGVLDKEIEFYDFIEQHEAELTSCLEKCGISANYKGYKENLVELRKTYKAFVGEKMTEVADAMCSEMHRAILNNAVEVLMAGLIIASSALAIVAPDLALYSLGFGLACGSVDMIYILFEKTVSRKAFRKIDFLASLSQYLHNYPRVDP